MVENKYKKIKGSLKFGYKSRSLTVLYAWVSTSVVRHFGSMTVAGQHSGRAFTKIIRIKPQPKFLAGE